MSEAFSANDMTLFIWCERNFFFLQCNVILNIYWQYEIVLCPGNIFRTAVTCHLHMYSELFIVKLFIKNSQVKMSNCWQFSEKFDSKYPWKHDNRFFYITWNTMSKRNIDYISNYKKLYPFAQEIFLGFFFLLC